MNETQRIHEHSVYDIISKVYPANYKERRKGDWWAVSPFTNERTPSFHVIDDKGIFKCFSTDLGGDAIRFVMEYEKIDFKEAIDRIFDILGWERDSQTYDKRPSTRRWFAEFAHQNLLKTVNLPHLRYLMSERKVSLATIKSEKLGFVSYTTPIPQDRLEELHAAGIVASDDSGRHYWFFGDRIILPYINVSGGVEGFTGRAIPGSKSKAKYKNSSEDQGFKKDRTLYGIHEARSAARRDGMIIAVEGQFDRIGLREAGILSSVSPGGTSLTENHAKALHSLGVPVYLWYDYDRAGAKAMIKAAKTLLSVGHVPYLIKRYKSTGDPDTIRQEDGFSAAEYIKEYTQTIPRYMAHIYGSATSAQKPKVVSVMKEVVSSCLMQFMADSLMGEFKDYCGISDDLAVSISDPAPVTRENIISSPAAKILSHLYSSPDDIAIALRSLGSKYKFEDPGLNAIWHYMKSGREIPLTLLHSESAKYLVEMIDGDGAFITRPGLEATCREMRLSWIKSERERLIDLVSTGKIESEAAYQEIYSLTQ